MEDEYGANSVRNLVELLELCTKRKKMYWNIRKSVTFSKTMELDADQMEKVFDFLEANNVDVLRITGTAGRLILDDDVDIHGLDDEEEVDMEQDRPVCSGRGQH